MAAAILFGVSVPHFSQAQGVLDAPPDVAFDPWVLGEIDRGIERWDVRFASPRPSGVAANDVVLCSVFLPERRTGPLPAVLILHYWGASDHRVENNMARELARRGIAGVVISLPYHMERCPPGFRSGELAITPDPVKLVETMTQSIGDVRRTVDFLESRPEIKKGALGISGTSLGSIVAALAAAVEPRFTDAAFVVGGIDLASILWNSSRVVRERDQMRKMGYTEQKLRDVLAPIEPQRFLAQRRPLNNLVVTAKFDTVIPPDNAKLLVEALGNPATVTLDTGHYGGFFVQKRIQNTVAEFFEAAFQGKPFDAPRSLNAPTVRLGVAISREQQFQIAAGLDLVRPNRAYDPFVSALVTPQGAQLFFGASLEKGLSGGVFVRPDRVSVGLFWSIVL